MVKDIDAWFKRAVDAGCEVKMPVETMFWGDRYCELSDPFGVRWAMNQARLTLMRRPATMGGIGWLRLREIPKVMLWAGRVLWAIFVLFMIMDVTMKLLRLPIVETTGAERWACRRAAASRSGSWSW